MNPPPFDLEAHVHRHGEALRRLARELVASAADADDALQDAWLAAVRSPIQSGRGANAHDPLGNLWIELAAVSVVNGETKQLELALPPEWDR